jgi:polyisoprenoid-binding protein YceI
MPKPGFFAAILLFALAPERAAGQGAPPDSVVYHVVPTSRFDVQTGKSGLFGFAGHPHLIRAHGVTGHVVLHPGATAKSHVELTVPTDSLVVLTPPDTAEIRKVTKAMREETLEVDQFPKIEFASKEVTPTDSGYHLVVALTMHGVTKDVPMDVVVEMAGDTLKAKGTFQAKQRDFGIKPFSGGPAGTVKVADKVTFSFEAVAVKGQQ